MRSVTLSLVILCGCAAPGLESSPRPSTGSTASPAPAARTAPPDGISRDEAVDIARDELGQIGEDWNVVLAETGPIGRVRPGWQDEEWGQRLAGDVPVWRVAMEAGELSAEVIIDLMDGSVYSSILGIAN